MAHSSFPSRHMDHVSIQLAVRTLFIARSTSAKATVGLAGMPGRSEMIATVTAKPPAATALPITARLMRRTGAPESGLDAPRTEIDGTRSAARTSWSTRRREESSFAQSAQEAVCRRTRHAAKGPSSASINLSTAPRAVSHFIVFQLLSHPAPGGMKTGHNRAGRRFHNARDFPVRQALIYPQDQGCALVFREGLHRAPDGCAQQVIHRLGFGRG